MSEKQTVKDDGSITQYAIVIPIMADDDLSAAQMRLYVHYKRLFAEKGKCEESVRETVRITGMSKYLVQKTRDELAELGYVTIEKPTKEQARKGQTVHVTLIDNWQENVSRYAKPVSKLIQQPAEGVSKLIQAVSDLPQPVSNLVQEAVSKLIRIDSPILSKTPNIKTPNPWYDVIQEVWGFTGGRNRDMEKMLRGTATKKQYAEYNLECPLTEPKQLTDWKDWYFKVKNNRNGAILPSRQETVQSSIGEFKAFQERKIAALRVIPPTISAAPPPTPADNLPSDDDLIDVAAELAKLNKQRKGA